VALTVGKRKGRESHGRQDWERSQLAKGRFEVRNKTRVSDLYVVAFR